VQALSISAPAIAIMDMPILNTGTERRNFMISHTVHWPTGMFGRRYTFFRAGKRIGLPCARRQPAKTSVLSLVAAARPQIRQPVRLPTEDRSGQIGANVAVNKKPGLDFFKRL
jgi:hypothetical protein